MPFIIKVISVALEYGMLFFLLFFVFRLMGYMSQELRAQRRKIRKTPTATVFLKVIQTNDERLRGKTFPLTSQVSIGRGSDNDISVRDNYVSHHHALITRQKNRYVIEDLKSANHTFVNDAPLFGKAYLRPGDIIRVGLLTLEFGR